MAKKGFKGKVKSFMDKAHQKMADARKSTTPHPYGHGAYESTLGGHPWGLRWSEVAPGLHPPIMTPPPFGMQ